MLTSQDGDGNTTTYHYQYIGPNANYGQVTEVDQPAISPGYPGNTPTQPIAHYVYNATSHDLTEAYDNYGAYTWYTYNQLNGASTHDIASTAVLTGTTTIGGTTSYHWRGQLWQYDSYGELTGVVDGRGVSVPDTTSPATQPSPSANANASHYTHSWTYDGQGNQTSSSTPVILTSMNGVVSIGPAVTQYTYDGDGNQVTMQSANNYNAQQPTLNATVYGYDHLGRQNSVKQPPLTLVNPPAQGPTTGVPLTTVEFDGDGNVSMAVEANGADIYYSYDPMGRLVATQQPLSLRIGPDPKAVAQTALTINTYTATNLASAQDPQGHVTQYTYDAANRLTSAVNGAGQQTHYGYDSANNLTSIAVGDPANPSSTIARTYDALNQVATQTVSGPGLSAALVTTYSYDLGGHLVRQQDPNNDTTFAGYDPAGELTSQELDPGAPNTPTGAHRETFAYDAAGNRVGSTDFRGGTTSMTVDADNRQGGQTDSYGGTPSISSYAQFDPDGNLVYQTQTIASQTTSFTATLNPADWPQSATNDNLTSSAVGDGGGDLLSQTIQNGAGTVAYNIDQTGRQNEITVTPAGGSVKTTIFNFNNNEQQTAIGLPNGIEQDAGYDGANRLASLTAVNNSNPALLNNQYQYGYDQLGLTAAITTTTQGSPSAQALTHDAAGRLVELSGGGVTDQWSYDGRGNLTASQINGVDTTYVYYSSNPEEVGLVSVGGRTTGYHYDGDGNTTSISDGGSYVRGLSYDAQSRLTQITLGSPVTATISMAYNALGQRSGYSVTPAGAGQPALSEHFTYQGDQLSQVATSGTGVPSPYTDTYIYTQDGQPLELLRQQGGTTTPYWYVTDGQGNVVALTDSGGNVVDSYSYDQWGAPISISERVPQQLRYRGYWYDTETGWYWLSVREYDPV